MFESFFAEIFQNRFNWEETQHGKLQPTEMVKVWQTYQWLQAVSYDGECQAILEKPHLLHHQGAQNIV